MDNAAERQLRIIGCNVGTRGDLSPYIRILQTAQERGHAVRMCTMVDGVRWIEGKGIACSRLFAGLNDGEDVSTARGGGIGAGRREGGIARRHGRAGSI